MVGEEEAVSHEAGIAEEEVIEVLPEVADTVEDTEVVEGAMRRIRPLILQVGMRKKRWKLEHEIGWEV